MNILASHYRMVVVARRKHQCRFFLQFGSTKYHPDMLQIYSTRTRCYSRCHRMNILALHYRMVVVARRKHRCKISPQFGSTKYHPDMLQPCSTRTRCYSRCHRMNILALHYRMVVVARRKHRCKISPQFGSTKYHPDILQPCSARIRCYSKCHRMNILEFLNHSHHRYVWIRML